MKHLKQAKRVDNGELVQGYYVCIAGEVHVIYTGKIDITYIKDGGGISWQKFEVDPATVEDVAVKPIRLEWEFAHKEGQYRHFCPNCEPECLVVNDKNRLEHCLTVFGQPDYCPWCGQRIDWSDGDGQ